MTAVNQWQLRCQGRTARAWMNMDYTVFGLTGGADGWAPENQLTLTDLGGGNVAFQLGSYQIWASMRDDYYFQVGFQTSNGGWVTQPGGDETFQIRPTGDGYFALYSPTFGKYVRINPAPDGKAQNCNPLYGADGNIDWAARFTAIGMNRASILDVVAVSRAATGMSFGGANLAGTTLPAGVDLSHCDFTGATGLSTASLAGANLKGAVFSGLKLAGLALSGADCTGANFDRADFTGFTPGSPPPTLTDAVLTRAVIPAGTSWSGAKLSGAVLAGANLTGADLSGSATDLSGADLSGVAGTTVPVTDYTGTGVAGFLLTGGDRVLAYDAGGTGHLDHLVAYMPGAGAVVVARRTGPGQYGKVYFQGAPGKGIGGFALDKPTDRIVAIDFTGNGCLDHLLCYSPGSGTAQVVANQGGGVFATVATFDKGFDQFPLTDLNDRVIAFDWTGHGRADHLLCYRPGGKLVTVLQRTGTTFVCAKSFTSGIGGWDLADPSDQVTAYDYAGTGCLDHVVVYRPGWGGVAIMEHRSDDTFAPVLWQGPPGDGIGGFILSDPADRIIAYDFAGTGKLDHLFCYRPGAGIVRILARKPATAEFDAVYSGLGYEGYDFAEQSDVPVPFDPAGTGTLSGLLLCRPDQDIVWVVLRAPAGAATLTGTKLAQTTLTGADLSRMDLRQPATVQGATLTGATLAGATLSGVNLSGATLAGTDFTGCDLSRTTFSSPFIRSTDPDVPTVFAGCRLPYTTIGLDWSCLDLTGATIDGVPTDLTGLRARGVRRPDAEFTEFVLDGADFSAATLDGSSFTSAKIRANGSTRATFAGARLLGTDFTEAVLDTVAFTSATLGGVEQVQATKFTFAYLGGCDFTGAGLFGVVFSGATLRGDNTLVGTSTLQEADFGGAYLADADLSGSNLQGATFDQACMIGVVLHGVDLTPAQKGAKPAVLTSAYLQGVDFSSVQLAAADLAGAVVTDARGTIGVSYYAEDGSLESETKRYLAAPFPDVTTAFTGATTCPNGRTYTDNVHAGLSVAQMMALKNAVKPWSPSGNRPRPHGPRDHDQRDDGRRGVGRQDHGLGREDRRGDGDGHRDAPSGGRVPPAARRPAR